MSHLEQVVQHWSDQELLGRVPMALIAIAAGTAFILLITHHPLLLAISGLLLLGVSTRLHAIAESGVVSGRPRQLGDGGSFRIAAGERATTRRGGVVVQDGGNYRCRDSRAMQH